MSYFLNKTGKELFRRHVQQYTPPDPLYEYSTDQKGKKRRSKRRLPPGLSERDSKILKSVQTRAHHLDKGFNLCGLRFGWTFFIALIPLAGSVAGAFLNYTLIIRKARQADIPPWLEARMVFNSAVSVGASLIPLVGDVILAVWKANSRNAVLLEEFLRIRGEEWLKQQEEQYPLRELEMEAEMGDATAATEQSKGWATFLPWRGIGKSDQKQAKPAFARMQRIEQPQSDDDPALPEQDSTPVQAGAEGSTTKSMSQFFNSRSRKGSSGLVDDADDVKAPPAGEKGRFVEHVPETNHQQLPSPP